MARYELSIVIVTVCRESLLRAIRSVYRQTFYGDIQILIGVDIDPFGKMSDFQEILRKERPANISIAWLNLGYSTSVRNGGVHECYFGGSLRSALTLLCDSEIVMYLDDDDWLDDDHCQDIVNAIQGRDWAFSYCIYSDGNCGIGVFEDKIESVGVDKGIFKKRFGGFVRPSGMAINKKSLLHLVPLWSCSPSPLGDGEDRLFFSKIKEKSHQCTGRASVFYTIDPNDGMHKIRVDFMCRSGVVYDWGEKRGSVRGQLP